MFKTRFRKYLLKPLKKKILKLIILNRKKLGGILSLKSNNIMRREISLLLMISMISLILLMRSSPISTTFSPIGISKTCVKKVRNCKRKSYLLQILSMIGWYVKITIFISKTSSKTQKLKANSQLKMLSSIMLIDSSSKLWKLLMPIRKFTLSSKRKLINNLKKIKSLFKL